MFNAITLSAPYNDDRFGIGFDPVMCSANHSCEPNVSQIFNQPETILRAIKSIKKGEEVFMRYVDVTNPRSVRRSELQQRYFFDCECSKCRRGPTTHSDTFLRAPEGLATPFLSIADGLIKRHGDKLAMHLNTDDADIAMRRLAAIQAEAFSVSGITQGSQGKQASEPEIKDALKLCLNSGMWSLQRQPVPHLLKQLFKYYIESRQRYPAWRVGLKMYFEGLFGMDSVSFRPERIIDLWTLATVTSTLNHPDMAHIRQECLDAGLDTGIVFAGLLLETHDNMPKAYGMDSPFGKMVHSVYEQAMAKSPYPEPRLREMVRETWLKLEVVGKNVDVLNL